MATTSSVVNTPRSRLSASLIRKELPQDSRVNNRNQSWNVPVVTSPTMMVEQDARGGNGLGRGCSC